MTLETRLLPRVKEHLILQHDADDSLIRGFIRAAVAYAEGNQHLPEGHYADNPMSATTELAVVMLSSHFYESRDGSTGGFFGSGNGSERYAMQTNYNNAIYGFVLRDTNNVLRFRTKSSLARSDTQAVIIVEYTRP